MTNITDAPWRVLLTCRLILGAINRQRIRHDQHATCKDKANDNRKMERFNGEIRDREKVMRSLKREDMPILAGYQIFHTHIRPHQALNGKAPADLCGIEAKEGTSG